MKIQSNDKGLNKINKHTNKIPTQFQVDLKLKIHFSHKSKNKPDKKNR